MAGYFARPRPLIGPPWAARSSGKAPKGSSTGQLQLGMLLGKTGGTYFVHQWKFRISLLTTIPGPARTGAT